MNAHAVDLCKKASRNKHRLARVTPYMTVRRILMNALFRSQVSYCPLVWMCHSITLNNKINRLHKRRLWIVYKDKHSNFLNLLGQDRSVSVHTRNLQTLAVSAHSQSANTRNQCTLAICKHLLQKCQKYLKVLHRRYLQIFSALILVQITVYINSLSLVDPS